MDDNRNTYDADDGELVQAGNYIPGNDFLVAKASTSPALLAAPSAPTGSQTQATPGPKPLPQRPTDRAPVHLSTQRASIQPDSLKVSTSSPNLSMPAAPQIQQAPSQVQTPQPQPQVQPQPQPGRGPALSLSDGTAVRVPAKPQQAQPAQQPQQSLTSSASVPVPVSTSNPSSPAIFKRPTIDGDDDNQSDAGDTPVAPPKVGSSPSFVAIARKLTLRFSAERHPGCECASRSHAAQPRSQQPDWPIRASNLG